MHSDGNRLAFSSRGRIFTIDLDGTNLRTVTASSTHLYERSEWSPDGQTLAFRGTHASVSSLFANYFVAGNAENVVLYDDYIQKEIMQLGEASNQAAREVGFVFWR